MKLNLKLFYAPTCEPKELLLTSVDQLWLK